MRLYSRFMIRVKTEVRKSEIHGTGVFATEPIHIEQVVWIFDPSLDRVLSQYAVKYGDPEIMLYIMERGYVNPARQHQWIVCVDEAQFLNFPRKGDDANLKLGGVIEGENVLLAARDIAPGEELTVPPESDADYSRKMEGR